ncbi:hypothetical protein K503DRAFT_402312 [Rhizopogon vinicolor AM-OR11-026]|uniref:Uncharacterized protein n=1 Tax=Rhizopogon vinicolor AM-OR11-026 TaxID=1314800 RepID=A0A1B7NBC4_9AGAM|nr:hypothetical protein K503DRAFT_402312 [Rhizopogon vinicolor AM-OR11-026]
MTPRASPSVSSDIRPAKQPRLSRSTLRVLSVWDQLAERYNKRLDEDDIVDLYSGTIISDRGVLKSAGKDYNIGHFAPDDSQDDEEQDQVDSEHDQDVDQDELDTLPTRDHSGTDGTMASTSELLRAVPPLSATTDADDLNEFLEVEKRRREILGDQDGEDDMSMEELAALREALGQSQEDEGQPEIVQEDESEDELSVWQHEASAVYHIARNESEQDVADGEQKINELTDSDEEFVKLLERPPRVEQRKRTYSSPSHLGISTGHTPVLNASPAASSTRFASRISSQDSPVPDTSLAHETILEQPPRVEKRKRISSSSSQRGISSGHTPAWSIVLNTPQTASSTRFVSRRSSQDIPVPDTPSAPSGTRSASRMSSKHTRVPDTPMAASSSRFASRISSEDIPGNAIILTVCTVTIVYQFVACSTRYSSGSISPLCVPYTADSTPFLPPC